MVARDVDAGDDATDPAPPAHRSMLASLAVGMATAIAVTGLTYALVAGPVYVLASIAPDGLDQPPFRTALIIGVIVCSVLGVVAGVAAGLWVQRGGRLPTDRTPYLDR